MKEESTLVSPHPLNALVHASGHVAQRNMMRVGLRLNLAAIVVIMLLFRFGVAG